MGFGARGYTSALDLQVRIKTHLVPDEINLDLSTAECERSVEPVLGLFSVVHGLVSHKGETSLRVDLEIGYSRIFETGGLSQVRAERGRGDGRREVENDQSGPESQPVSLDDTTLGTAYILRETA